jgi:hypothetical protein
MAFRVRRTRLQAEQGGGTVRALVELVDRRDPPYHLITDGIQILLLNTWTERGGGSVVDWLVTAREVHTAQFPDKRAAIRAIARWAGETPRWVRDGEYSERRPDNSGTVIYWRAEPVRRLGVPRPPGLAVGRNGWLVTDDESLRVLGVDVSPQGRETGGAPKDNRRRKATGQGRRVDEVMKKGDRAARRRGCKRWCRVRGWTAIRDTGKTEAWDLQGEMAGVTRYMEVKGTTGDRTESK